MYDPVMDAFTLNFPSSTENRTQTENRTNKYSTRDFFLSPTTSATVHTLQFF